MKVDDERLNEPTSLLEHAAAVRRASQAERLSEPSAVRTAADDEAARAAAARKVQLERMAASLADSLGNDAA